MGGIVLGLTSLYAVNRCTQASLLRRGLKETGTGRRAVRRHGNDPGQRVWFGSG